MKPLFDILEGDPHLTSPRSLKPSALEALQKIKQAITKAQLYRLQPQEPFDLCILQTTVLPTAVLWQQGPLIWIHPQASPAKTIEYYPTAVVKLALKTALIYFGLSPKPLLHHIPLIRYGCYVLWMMIGPYSPTASQGYLIIIIPNTLCLPLLKLTPSSFPELLVLSQFPRGM